MTDGFDLSERLGRLEREVLEVENRVRTVENVSSPYQQAIRKQINDIAGRVEIMRSFDTNTKLDNLRADVQEIKDETKATRLLIRSTLITAASGIALGLINFVVYRASHG